MGFSLQVIGHRMPFPEPVAASASSSWFCFHFHHPVVAGTRDGERTLPAETVLITARGEPLSHRPAGNQLLRSWIRCDGSLLAGLMAEAGLTTRTPYPLAPGAEAMPALLALHHACTHPRGVAPGHRLALFRAWLHTVFRDSSRGHPGKPGIETVRRHLEENHLLPQRLDELARLAGCSRAQLCRSFRRAAGCSPLQYVLRLRLEAARELLTTTRQDIPAIAQACGFSDRYHFSRAFSARYGQGPAAYRRR